jgi:hypothetical protein
MNSNIVSYLYFIHLNCLTNSLSLGTVSRSYDQNISQVCTEQERSLPHSQNHVMNVSSATESALDPSYFSYLKLTFLLNLFFRHPG